jgi:DNA-binding MltR family transcriptional regulator
MNTDHISTQYDNFADDLLAERTPRTMVIVGSSRIDTLLCDILCSYLLPKRAKAKDNDELLEGDRPLSTFSSRIKLCYRLGIIDDSFCDALEILRALRNDCAHAVTFDAAKSPARDHIANLHSKVSCRQSFALVKDRYYNRDITKTEELPCVLLTLCALLEAVKEKIQRTTGTNATLTITRR